MFELGTVLSAGLVIGSNDEIHLFDYWIPALPPKPALQGRDNRGRGSLGPPVHADHLRAQAIRVPFHTHDI
jgi:hypothetical protein